MSEACLSCTEQGNHLICDSISASNASHRHHVWLSAGTRHNILQTIVCSLYENLAISMESEVFLAWTDYSRARAHDLISIMSTPASRRLPSDIYLNREGGGSNYSYYQHLCNQRTLNLPQLSTLNTSQAWKCNLGTGNNDNELHFSIIRHRNELAENLTACWNKIWGLFP